jgi:phospholipid transport system substrate-binding protein
MALRNVMAIRDAIERRILLWTLLGAAILQGAVVAADAELPAQALIRETTDRLIVAVQRDRDAIEADPGHAHRLIEEILSPHVDFRRMASRALGKYWRKVTPEQRDKFTREFKTLLVRTYSTALNSYEGQEIQYLTPRERPEHNTVIVRARVARIDAPEILLNYALYLTDDAWTIFDVSIDGVSLVINYRSSFTAEIRQNGMDSLVARLADKNQEAVR